MIRKSQAEKIDVFFSVILTHRKVRLIAFQLHLSWLVPNFYEKNIWPKETKNKKVNEAKSVENSKYEPRAVEN